MTNKIFFFCDIDDTLIQTKRKTDFTKSTIVGAYTKEGEENSFYYEGTKLFIDTLLKAGITVIPTTARNFDSYNRTTLAKEKEIIYVILNFGGTILINGKIDKEWQDKMNLAYSKILLMQTVSLKVEKALEKTNIELVIKIPDGFYVSIYNKFHLNDKKVLKSIDTILNKFLKEHTDFYLYKNDNSFALLPNFLNKEFGVKYLKEKYNPILTLGAGDNESDLAFMNQTDFKIIPQKVKIKIEE